MEREKVEHDSFGMISISRINCTGERFFGSELKQNNYIELRINQGEMERDLTCDRFFSRSVKNIVKVRMTNIQFSELITNLGNSDGACCTIEQINGKYLDKLPFIENRKEFVHNSFEQRMKTFQKTLQENQNLVKTLSKKKNLSKVDAELLVQTMNWLTTEITQNIPYFSTCFQETMDEVVSEAKLEIESAVQHKIYSLGVETLASQNHSREEMIEQLKK